MAPQDPSIPVQNLPHSWQLPIAIGLFLIPLLGRAYHAVKSGGGLKGIWQAIMFGTNQPTDKTKQNGMGQLPIVLLLCGTLFMSACGTTGQTTFQKPLDYGIDKIEQYQDSTVIYWHVKATGITPDNVGIIVGDISKEKIVIDNTTFDNTGLGAKGKVIIKK